MPSSGCQKCALDRKSTRLNSSHTIMSYAVFCLKKKKTSAGVTSKPLPPASQLTTQPRTPRRRARRGRGSPRSAGSGAGGGGGLSLFFFNDTATTEIYTLSLHDALPI